MKKLLITLTIIIAAVLYAPSAAAVTSGYKTVYKNSNWTGVKGNIFTPSFEVRR